MTELERKIKAKIPGPDTGIEVRHTICDICSPGMHCGINAYIKDGKVIKIEGIDGHPSNDGRLCTKGLSNRQYIYREDRVLTPLKRVGKRGGAWNCLCRKYLWKLRDGSAYDRCGGISLQSTMHMQT